LDGPDEQGHKTLKHAICFLSALGMVQALAEPNFGAVGLVETLGPESVYSGCGCTFRRVSQSSNVEGPVIFSSNYEGSARIATGSGAVTLSATKADTECEASALGDHCVLKYRAADIQVEIKVRATWVCPSEHESCDVTRFRGQMTTRRGAQKEKLDIEGDCGC
jgi:hypothetical protein